MPSCPPRLLGPFPNGSQLVATGSTQPLECAGGASPSPSRQHHTTASEQQTRSKPLPMPVPGIPSASHLPVHHFSPNDAQSQPKQRVIARVLSANSCLSQQSVSITPASHRNPPKLVRLTNISKSQAFVSVQKLVSEVPNHTVSITQLSSSASKLESPRTELPSSPPSPPNTIIGPIDVPEASRVSDLNCSSVMSVLNSSNVCTEGCSELSKGELTSSEPEKANEQLEYDSDDEDEKTLCIDEEYVSKEDTSDDCEVPSPPKQPHANVKPSTLVFKKKYFRSSESPPCSDEGYLSATPQSADDSKQQLPFSDFLQSHPDQASLTHERKGDTESVEPSGPHCDLVETVLLDSKDSPWDDGNAVHLTLEAVELNTFADKCFKLEFVEPEENKDQTDQYLEVEAISEDEGDCHQPEQSLVHDKNDGVVEDLPVEDIPVEQQVLTKEEACNEDDDEEEKKIAECTTCSPVPADPLTSGSPASSNFSTNIKVSWVLMLIYF